MYEVSIDLEFGLIVVCILLWCSAVLRVYYVRETRLIHSVGKKEFFNFKKLLRGSRTKPIVGTGSLVISRGK